MKITKPNISDKTKKEMVAFFRNAGVYERMIQAHEEGVDINDEKEVERFLERLKERGNK